MPSLSERAKELIQRPYKDHPNVFITDPLAEVVADAMIAIESLTEARVAASNHIERLELRIEELEAQVSHLTPPKDIGPFVKPTWKKLSESDLQAEGM